MTELTEAGREARREYLRRYRAEHREELNRKRREKYAATKERAQAAQARYWNGRAAKQTMEDTDE